jgi:phosphohistidine swiveling domain-containing protein
MSVDWDKIGEGVVRGVALDADATTEVEDKLLDDRVALVRGVVEEDMVESKREKT